MADMRVAVFDSRFKLVGACDIDREERRVHVPVQRVSFPPFTMTIDGNERGEVTLTDLHPASSLSPGDLLRIDLT